MDNSRDLIKFFVGFLTHIMESISKAPELKGTIGALKVVSLATKTVDASGQDAYEFQVAIPLNNGKDEALVFPSGLMFRSVEGAEAAGMALAHIADQLGIVQGGIRIAENGKGVESVKPAAPLTDEPLPDNVFRINGNRTVH
jgi:hypothetical protein